MAQWLISRTPDGADVVYVNLLNGQRFECGHTPLMTDDEILNWILDTGKPGHGDRICLSDGTSFHYSAPSYDLLLPN
jgi:hypothetical protein